MVHLDRSISGVEVPTLTGLFEVVEVAPPSTAPPTHPLFAPRNPVVTPGGADPPGDPNIDRVPVQGVGGRLFSFRDGWLNEGCSPSKLSLVNPGYCLPFLSRPPLSRVPLITSGYRDSSRDKILDDCIQELLAKNALESVRRQRSLGFYSRLFLVPKPGNRWRPVIDLSCLNQFLDVQKFKLETPESIRASLQPGEWFT